MKMLTKGTIFDIMKMLTKGTKFLPQTKIF